jgi:hypothetical protein
LELPTQNLGDNAKFREKNQQIWQGRLRMVQQEKDNKAILQRNPILPVRITIKIVKNRNPYRIVGNLATHFGLEVNTVATLSDKEQQCSWFDLELLGTQKQIDSALIYLSALKISPVSLSVFDRQIF